MSQDIQKLFIESRYLELGYLAFRQSFFRHGNLVKVLNESRDQIFQGDLPSFRPNLCHLSGSYSDSRLQSPNEIGSSIFGDRKRTQLIGLTATDIVNHSLSKGINLKKLLGEYRDAGLDYLEGFDLIPSLSNSTTSSSIWFEVHELAHSLGIKSEVTLYPHDTLNFETIEKTLARLDDIQRSSRGFLFINFPNVGSIEDQLKLIATTRILAKEIHDFKIEMDRNNIISGQVKLGFGINVVSRSFSPSLDEVYLKENEFETILKRSHRVPVDFVSHTLNEQEAQAFNSMKLYRLRHSNQHDLNHLLEVVSQSPLPAIGASVEQTNKSLNYFEASIISVKEVDKHVDEYPSKCILDFTGVHEQDFLNYSNFITSVSKHIALSPESSWSALGLRGLWLFSQVHKVELAQLARDLKSVGIKSVASAELESEESITNSEIISLHRQFHEQGIATVAKLELAAPYNGTDAPFWEPFLQRLLQFVDLNHETGLMDGVIIQESQHSFIAIQDYLKAVAMTRIVARDMKNIITPVGKLAQGVIQPKIHTEEEYANVLNLLRSFGGTHLGLKKSQLLSKDVFLETKNQNSRVGTAF